MATRPTITRAAATNGFDDIKGGKDGQPGAAGTGTVNSVNGIGPSAGNVTLPAFTGSGTGHAAGLVPDPGSTAGTTKFLREDGTFAVPPGSGSSTSDVRDFWLFG